MTLVLYSINEVKQGTKCFCDPCVNFQRPLHLCKGVPLNLPSIPPGPLLKPGYAIQICPKANEVWHSHDTCIEILAPHGLQDPRDHVMAEETMGVMKDVRGDHFVGLDMWKMLPEGLTYSTQAVFCSKAVVTECCPWTLLQIPLEGYATHPLSQCMCSQGGIQVPWFHYTLRL